MAFTKKIAGWVAGRIKGEKARKDTMRWMEKTGLGQILDIAGDAALVAGAAKGAGALKGLLTGGKAAQAGQAAAQTQAAIAAGPKPSASLISGSVPPAPARAISQAAATPSPASLGMGAAKAAPMAAPMAAPVAAPAAAPAVMQAPMRAPMQAMVAPPTAPAIRPAPVPTGMTPQMTKTAGQMGGMQNVANANITRGPGLGRSILQGAKEYAPLIQATAGPVANVIGQRMEQSLEEERMKREQDARNRLAMLLMPMFQAQMGQAAPSFQPRG